MTNEDEEANESEHSAYGLKPANDSFNPALHKALASVRSFAEQESAGGRDKLEIITDLMRGPNGTAVEDAVAVIGWPLEIIRSTFSALSGLVVGGQEQTIISKMEVTKFIE